MLEMEIRRFEPLEYQAKEAINTLCTNLFFAGGDIKKIMITSCRPQEGKSFVAMNLMRSLAGLGMKVVLVDADIRASALQGVYDIHANLPEGVRYAGLTRYLAGRNTMDEIVAQTNIPNASMVLSGHNVTNSLPLLKTPRLRKLLDALAQEYDIVLVDAPPVGTIIDAAQIAPNCDGVLFVVQSGAVQHSELQLSMQQIEKTGVPILGTVLNQFDEYAYGDRYYYNKSSYSRYNGGYGTEYGSKTQKKSGTAKVKTAKTAASVKRRNKR